MAEQETPPVQTEHTVVPTQVTTETIGSDGKTLGNNASLSDIFAKAEAGTPIEEAIASVMKPEKAERAKEDVKETKAEPEQKSEEPVKEEADPASDDSSVDGLKKSLEKSLEKKVAEKAKTTEKKEDVKGAEKKDDEAIAEDELKVLPHDKPRTAKRIDALLGKIKQVSGVEAETKKQLDAKENKLKELEAELNKVKSIDPTTNEEIKKQLDELKMYRRRYSLENDPEFKAKFDDRISKAETPIFDILKRAGLEDPMLKIINEAGGWTAFASSTKKMKLANGQSMSGSEIVEAVMNELPIGDRKAVEAAMLEKIQTQREKDRYVEEESKNASKYFEEQSKKEKEASEASRRQTDEMTQNITKWHEGVIKDSDFLKDHPIPSDATKEKKEEIERNNKYNSQLRGLLNHSLNAKDLPTMLSVVLDSVKYYDERRRTAALSDENARLRKELETRTSEVEKVKTSSRSTPKSGSIAGGGASEQVKEPAKPKSLEDALDRIAAGESV